MTEPIDIDTVLTCDEVRREDNGKAIIIGVYVSDILLSKIPATIGMTWYLQGKNKVEIDYEVEFKISAEGDSSFNPIEVKANFNASPLDSTAVLVLGQLPIKFERPCTLVLSKRTANDEWRELTRRKVLVKPAIFPTAP